MNHGLYDAYINTIIIGMNCITTESSLKYFSRPTTIILGSIILGLFIIYITIENIAMNLFSLSVGVSALLAKQGVSWLVNKITKSLGLKKLGKDLERPV